MPNDWFNSAFTSLPATDDEFFRRLWSDRRLLFDGTSDPADSLDEYCARLASAALRRKRRLLITLPDLHPHRPALLFATTLLRSWWDSRTAQESGENVIYFGSMVGIRDQLKRTSVRKLDLNLADVFGQRDLGRRNAEVLTTRLPEESGLPRVTTIYAPSNPVTIIQTHRPNWIAIDCADSPSLPWLQPLLRAAYDKNIPVIAWAQNPLAEYIRDFAAVGDVFRWPLRICSSHSKIEGDPETILRNHDATSLCAVVLSGANANSYSSGLQHAAQLLANASHHAVGGFTRDALTVHWRFLRTLETLAVPLDFYEAEAPRFWGVKSIAQIRSACAQFREACATGSPRLYMALEEIDSVLDRALKQLEATGCPLWNALSNVCIEESEVDEARLITFSSDSRKILFLFALLARHNITESDLREFGIWITSLRELRRWVYRLCVSPNAASDEDPMMPPVTLKWHPILAGLPTPTMTSKLMPVFLQAKADVIMYPHQRTSFTRRQIDWSSQLCADLPKDAMVLSDIMAIGPPSSLPRSIARITVTDPIEMNAESAEKTKVAIAEALWQPKGAEREIALLFQDEDTIEEVSLKDEFEGVVRPMADDPQDMVCGEALKIMFDQGWSGFFALDDRINVVTSGLHGLQIEPRYVRSLKDNDQVVVIQGQHRQSLYDLIISRVHKHPSIELHLALIRRWQEDLRLAYELWQSETPAIAEFQKSGSRDPRGLLSRINDRGSRLESPLTLTLWLKGLVLCPLDREDLRRVAEVLDMEFERQHYKRIAQAANRLRGLHRGLANRLNRWLEEQAAGAVRQDDDDLIDEELGLTFGDLRNSLLILRVRRSETVQGPFLRSNLGQMEREI